MSHLYTAKRQQIFLKGMPKRRIIVLLLVFSSLTIWLNFTTFDDRCFQFFAKHYRMGWFSTYDSHLSGGMSLRTYPPLFFQLTAILSYIFPLDFAYSLMKIVSWFFLPTSLTLFIADYLNMKKGLYLIYLLLFFSSGLLIELFVYGQVTSILGLAFGFLAIFYFNRMLMNKKYMIKFVLALSLTAFIHHLAFLITLMFLALLFGFEISGLKNCIKEVALSMFLSSLIIILGLFLLIHEVYETFFSGLAPKEIKHASREPLLTFSPLSIDFKGLKQRIIFPYGISLVMLLFPLLKRERQFMKIYTIAIFFLVLGLGRTTFLPKLIFWPFEYWFTYERFTFMSSLLLTPLIPIFLQEVGKKMNIERFIPKVLKHGFVWILIILYIICSYCLLFLQHKMLFNYFIHDYERDKKINTIIEFLRNKSSEYRYQTFGCNPPIGDIYFYTDVPTLDGDYHTGRRVEWLKQSGVEWIDTIYYQGRMDFLHEFMKHADEYSVKYIIICNRVYEEYLNQYNWTKTYEDGVVFLENPRSLKPVTKYVEDINLLNYFWGFIPLLSLILFLYVCGSDVKVLLTELRKYGKV